MKKRTTILMTAILALILLSSRSFADQPIKGTVTYHNDETKPIPSVVVELYSVNDEGEQGEFITSAVTNINGKYIFPNISYGTYFVKPVNTTIAPGGVDDLDVAALDALLGPNGPIAPLQEIIYLASDVTGEGILDEADITYLATHLPDNFDPSWVFESGKFINHDGTKTNVPTMGGSSSGDVNGTFVPIGRNEIATTVSYFQKNFTSNFSIEVFAKDITEASAMSLVVEYPSVVDIKGVTSQIGDITSLRIEDNRIIVNWFNEDLASKSINSSEPIIVILGNTNQKYNGGDIKFSMNNQSHFLTNGEISRPAFSVPYLSTGNNDYLSHCYPNPANEKTTVYFDLPCDSKTTLNIYNLNGQLVRTVVNEMMTAGQHTVIIPVTDIKEGVYFYSLTTSGNININQSKRLVIVH